MRQFTSPDSSTVVPMCEEASSPTGSVCNELLKAREWEEGCNVRFFCIYVFMLGREYSFRYYNANTGCKMLDAVFTIFEER